MAHDDHELLLLITRTTIEIREAIGRILNRYGLARPQNLVLDALAEQDGLTPGEIARRLEVTGPTAVKMAQRMEASGVVERRRDDPDGRLVRVYLTDRGRAIQDPVRQEVERLAEAAVAGLSRHDRQAMRRGLQRVRMQLDRS